MIEFSLSDGEDLSNVIKLPALNVGVHDDVYGI